MANTYLQFSEYIHGSKEALDWFEEYLEKKGEEDDYLEFEYERESETKIWVSAEEYGEPQSVAEAVAKMQIQFPESPPFTLSFCYYCSKLRINEFGGGALIVNKGKIKYMNSSHGWIDKELIKLEKNASK